MKRAGLPSSPVYQLLTIILEIARTNTRAAFDYARELLGVKSPSEFIELSTAQMRKQFDIASAQNKDLCALAQQVATEAAEPIKTGVSKLFSRHHVA